MPTSNFVVYMSPDELENENSFHLNPEGQSVCVQVLSPLGGSAGSGGGRDESGLPPSVLPLGVLDPRPLLSALPREVARVEGLEDGLGFALGADASRCCAEPLALDLDAPGSGL